MVLPAAGYALLAVEAALLAWLWATHDLSAADRIGHGIGWAGTASMLAMHVYSVRKRVRALSSWGKLSRWLHLHIFLGLQGALFVTFHSLHLHTLQSISGATIALTAVVVVSGAFGRYLYSFIPKGLTGERLSAREVEAELAALEPLVADGAAAHAAIADALAAHSQAVPLTGRMTLRELIREDLRTRRALRGLSRALRADARTHTGAASDETRRFAAAVRRRGALARRLAVLTGAERLFRNWHLFHKPLTFVLLGAVILHVVAHYIYAAGMGGG
ncbi:MAG: hypothetical protein JWN44_2541 [Myxococcales bacterium]|nr:hypothetical protein [Myxococcales bacterium]